MVISDKEDGSTIFCHTETGAFFRTNEIGALIWDWSENATADHVADALRQKFPDVDGALIATDVRNFLESLVSAGMLEMKEDGVLREETGDGRNH